MNIFWFGLKTKPCRLDSTKVVDQVAVVAVAEVVAVEAVGSVAVPEVCGCPSGRAHLLEHPVNHPIVFDKQSEMLFIGSVTRCIATKIKAPLALAAQPEALAGPSEEMVESQASMESHLKSHRYSTKSRAKPEKPF